MHVATHSITPEGAQRPQVPQGDDAVAVAAGRRRPLLLAVACGAHVVVLQHHPPGQEWSHMRK